MKTRKIHACSIYFLFMLGRLAKKYSKAVARYWRNCLDKDQRLFRNVLKKNLKWREPGIWTEHNCDTFCLTLKCFKAPHFKCHKVKNLIQPKELNNDKSSYLYIQTIKTAYWAGLYPNRFALSSLVNMVFATVRIIIRMSEDRQTYFSMSLNSTTFIKQDLLKLKNNILQDRRQRWNANNHINIWIRDVIR